MKSEAHLLTLIFFFKINQLTSSTIQAWENPTQFNKLIFPVNYFVIGQHYRFFVRTDRAMNYSYLSSHITMLQCSHWTEIQIIYFHTDKRQGKWKCIKLFDFYINTKHTFALVLAGTELPYSQWFVWCYILHSWSKKFWQHTNVAEQHLDNAKDISASALPG